MASVGLATLRDAKRRRVLAWRGSAAGVSARDAAFTLRLLGMTRLTNNEAPANEANGFMKVLVGARNDRILGFTMIGPEAGEVMAAVQTAILAGMPYTCLRDAILAHPTMAEGLGSLFSNVPSPPAH
jgi:pyruvate/2-oxoglutarate dehydrogenase complex dihydrolipoamide dehydrogenase (E3) component